MIKKLMALLLVLVLLFGCLAGCAANQTGPSSTAPDSQTKTEDAASNFTAKYAYAAEYIDLDLKGNALSRSAVLGGDLYTFVEVMTDPGNQPEVDGDMAVPYDMPMLGVAEEEPMAEEMEIAPEELEKSAYIPPTYETRLYKINLRTGAVEHQTWYQPLEIPEGAEGYTNVEYFGISKDGTIWICDYCESYTIELPANFNPETDNEWNYQVAQPAVRRLCGYSADGTLLKTATFPETEEGVFWELTLVDEKGRLYMNIWGEEVRVYENDGTFVKSLNYGTDGGYLTTFCGVPAVEMWGEERRFCPINTETLEIGESISLPANGYDYQTSPDAQYDFLYDYSGNLYGYKSKEQVGEKLVDWLECDVDMNSIQQTILLDDGTVAGLCYDYEGGEHQLVVLTRVDPASLPQKTTLRLACMWLDWNLREKIVEFNRESQTHRIIVDDYSQYATQDDYQAGLTKLNTEIISGKVPDIFCTTDLPIRQYAAQGLLEDLLPYLQNDPQLGENAIMPEALQAVMIGGKLYQTFAEYSISTTVALEKVVGGYDTWTIDEIHDAMENLQEGASIFDVGYTRESMLSECISRSMTQFIDWDTGTCSFDSEQFKNYLAFAAEFPEEFDWENFDWEEYVDGPTALRSGKQLMLPTYISSVNDYLWTLASIQEPVCFVGYPSTDMNGSTFSFSNGLSVSSTCEDKEAAWSFVRMFFTEEYQRERDWGGLSSNRAVFEEKIEEAMTIEYETDADGNFLLDENGEKIVIPKAQAWSGDEEYTIDVMSQEQYDAFMELYRSASGVYDRNEEVLEIIKEESAYYFSGQRSVDDAAAMIQNRVNLFVAEQR